MFNSKGQIFLRVRKSEQKHIMADGMAHVIFHSFTHLGNYVSLRITWQQV